MTTRVIEASPALLDREQKILAGFTDSLAELLREETGAKPEDLEPWVAANALIGVHRALLKLARAEVLAGTRNPALSRRGRAQEKRALAGLDAGLGAYAVKS